MNHMLNVSTTANFLSNQVKLEWAKRNLDTDTYNKIKRSYNSVIKYTLIVTLVLVVMIFVAITMAFSAQASVHSAYDTWKKGHVSGNIVWYINNDKYEVELSDHGYNPADFSDGDIFRVYLDESGSVIKILSDNDVNKTMEDNIAAIVMVGSLIIMIIVLLCIHLPIAINTYGKIWHKYGIWFGKADLGRDKFII